MYVSIAVDVYVCTYAYMMGFFCNQPFFRIEFIGMTLVNRTTQVSSVRPNKTSSAYCIVHLPPKVKSLFAPTYPPFAHFHLTTPPFPSSYHHTAICVYVSYMYMCIYTHTYMCMYTHIYNLSRRYAAMQYEK